MLQIGKMYLVKEYFWYVFPTKKVADRVQAVWWSMGAVVACGRSVGAWRNAKVLSEDYNCNVFVVEPKTCFVLLEMDEAQHCYKLLDCNGNIGWIICRDFSNYFELVKE
jgi:hypothetical protein